MLVVGFARGAFQARLAIGARFACRAWRGDELHFFDKLSAPGLIDARAKFLSHRFELALPILAVSRNFQAAIFAS